MPVSRSQMIGLRLCGIAELPFWPLPKGSSASRTSVRCRCRISIASFSSVAPQRAIAASELGVAVALHDLGAHRGETPARADRQTFASTAGSMCAKVPTGTGNLAHGDGLDRGHDSLARRGAAGPPRPATSARRSSARRGCRGCARSSRAAMLLGPAGVSASRTRSTSLEEQLAGVAGTARPGWCREGRCWSCRGGPSGCPGPMYSAMLVRKAMTSWLVTFLDLEHALRIEVGLFGMSRAASAGISPSSASASQAATSTSRQISKRRWSAHRAAISGVRIALDHDGRQASTGSAGTPPAA